MEACPSCGRNVPIPFFMLLSGWVWRLTCPHCRAGLERRQPRFWILIALLPLFFFMFGPDLMFRIPAVLLIVAVVPFLLWEMTRPKLHLRDKATGPARILNLEAR